MSKKELNNVSDDLTSAGPIPIPQPPMAKNTKSNPNNKNTKDTDQKR